MHVGCAYFPESEWYAQRALRFGFHRRGCKKIDMTDGYSVEELPVLDVIAEDESRIAGVGAESHHVIANVLVAPKEEYLGVPPVHRRVDAVEGQPGPAF